MKGSWELVDLYPGAWIRTKANNFYHHGIYIGNGEVVQFGLPFSPYAEISEVKVLRSPISDFTEGESNAIEVYVFSPLEKMKKQPDEKIVETAIAHVGDGDYSVLNNNCEHFATFCVYGKKASSQIDNVYEQVKKMLAK